MLRSIALLQAAQILGRGLFFVFTLWYLNTYLGVAAKGAWFATFSLFAILSVFANLGFEVWLSRAVAAKTLHRRTALRALLMIKGPLWLLALIVGAISVDWGDPVEAALAPAFAAALILDGVGVSQQAVFEGLSATKEMALMTFLKSGGFAIVALLTPLLIAEPELMVFGWLFAGMLLVRVIYGWRCWSLLPSTGPTGLDRRGLRAIVTMGAYTLVTVLYFKIDAVMLDRLAGPVAAGDYGNAYDWVEGLLFFSAAVGTVMYPRLVVAEPSDRGPLFDRAMRFLMVSAACGSGALWLLGPVVGTWLVGGAYDGATPLLRVLAVGLPFMFVNGLLSRWLFAAGREGFALKTAAWLAVFNIAGNAWAIPRYGAAGAAAMTLLTEGLLFVVWSIAGRGSARPLLWFLAVMTPVGLAAMLTDQTGWMWAGVALVAVALIWPLVRSALDLRRDY